MTNQTTNGSPLSRALDQILDGVVVSGRIAGGTLMVAQDGETVYHRAFGHADREAGVAMSDSLPVRLASLTKPLVSATALALVERGVLALDAPVADWLPDFQPALPDGRRPVIRLHHLLSHTAGLGYRFLQPPDGPYHQADISDGLDIEGRSLDDNLARIAAAPLLFEPGMGWCYSVATDVLGAVIAKADGGDLAESVARRVTEPLGMMRTRFGASDPGALAPAYIDGETGARRMADPDSAAFGPARLFYRPSRAFSQDRFPSGGSGMTGTAPDYLTFLETIRTGGGAVLSPESCARMTVSATGGAPVFIPSPGWGFGLGFGVLTDPAAAGSPCAPGSWGWFGVFGSHFWVDPVRRITLVAVTNTAVSGMAGPFADALRDTVVGG
ncbi:serine hydrolase domain-containing protein [Azospirillum griseum]|uniref:Class A beta-lactamase-related serine hydrolase n=1 Tax=Azospirillum griseum TaxID=2496639 RepID=A0A431VKS9_9PROT|nr:serine hydrolase domain-containing protein [Azospirillum griseum]RTR23034.1 class A beta-lactamase-related serine hydrolase [Azospirillum griseum]